MGTLSYTTITSLDGFVEDATGSILWGRPDEEVSTFANELTQPIRTYLFGRRMYETMRVWETWGFEPDDPPDVREFAEHWRATEKVVYSRTLGQPSTERTRIEQSFDPEAVRALKREAGDLSVGGATLAGEAMRLGLVDELQLLVVPVLVGGGLRTITETTHLELELLDTRRFAGGTVYLRYRIASVEGGTPQITS